MWVINYNGPATMCCIRNLYWEGFYSYCVIDSNEFGSAYFGLGVPNFDIAFML